MVTIAPVIPISREAPLTPAVRYCASVLAASARESGVTQLELRRILAGVARQGYGLSPAAGAAVLRAFRAA